MILFMLHFYELSITLVFSFDLSTRMCLLLMLQATILEIFAELCHKNVYLFILNTATATYHNFYPIQQNKEMNEENFRFLT